MERSIREALAAFAEPRRQVLQCVTRSPLLLSARTSFSEVRVASLALASAPLARFQSHPRIEIDVEIRLQVREERSKGFPSLFALQTVGYTYGLTTQEREIIAFHWVSDAAGRDGVQHPHLHVGKAVLADREAIRPGEFHKVHVPTGLVALQDVVGLAIREFGVRPLRPDWEAILAETPPLV